MPARTRSELPLFRTCMGSDADNAAKQTVAGNKTARKVFKGQCAENCWEEAKTRACARRLLCSECNFVGCGRPRSVSRS